MKKPRILALDLGTKTGWAVSSLTGLVGASGVESFAKLGRFEGGGMRFLNFRAWLDRIYQEVIPELVLFEEVRRHVGTDAAHVYGGFMAHLTAWCEELKIPYQGVPVGTIKKFTTGKGNASKEQMIQVAQARAAITKVQDDNEADAICLLLYGLHTHWGQLNATPVPDLQRPALHSEPRRRIQIRPVPAARKRVRIA